MNKKEDIFLAGLFFLTGLIILIVSVVIVTQTQMVERDTIYLFIEGERQIENPYSYPHNYTVEDYGGITYNVTEGTIIFESDFCINWNISSFSIYVSRITDSHYFLYYINEENGKKSVYKANDKINTDNTQCSTIEKRLEFTNITYCTFKLVIGNYDPSHTEVILANNPTNGVVK